MATTKERIHVLHVDDESGLTQLVADCLEREDDRIAVETAPSASEGLDRITEGSFDCIVSDYAMPGQNGIEFLQTLREEYPDLPFILYTGKGSEEVASEAISAGATDYLQKRSGTEQYELLANRILNAAEQARARQRAADLERIRTLVNDINQALIRANSRAELETRVCEIISESDPYMFAWIGEVDAETDRVVPRTWAGVEAGYLEEITLSTDKTGTGRGPTGTALREGRISISQKVAEDPDFEWQQAALDRGYRAMAAVPLEYENELYGGLNVYADRPDAFNPDEQDVLVELGDDIGHAIHAEKVKEDLERARHRAEQYFETAGNIMVVLNRDGTVARINERGCDLLDFERSELLGSNWLDRTAPADIEDKIDEILFSFWEDSAEPIFKNTNPIETKDGEPVVVKWHNTALRDQDGNVSAVLCSGIDITERKQNERKLEEQRNQLEVLNQLLRHDVRNDLQLVTAYADPLEDALDENQEPVEMIQENARHAIDLTTTARDMADVWLSESEAQSQITLKSTLQRVIDEARSAHTDSVIQVAGEIPDVPVLADDMLPSMFDNLLKNAIQHCDKDIPKVTVSVDDGEETVQIRVADNGPGVPDERKERIFGRGEKGLDSSRTGLGLYLVQTLIDKYDGAVWVEDNDPDGAVFVVELQRSSQG